MKRLAAIFFAGILLFNLVGYKVVFSWLEHRSIQTLSLQLDQRSYNPEHLITIKVPVNALPYYTNSPIFERTDGSITIGGATYQYVEKRIFNDSIEMRCIPNAQTTSLANARDLFFQLVNDLNQTNSSGKTEPAKRTISQKNILTDYTLLEEVIGFEPDFCSRTSSFNLFLLKESSQYYSPQEQPPDALVTV